MSISKLSVLNALLPKDAGVTRVGAGIPFGREARQKLDVHAPEKLGSPLPVVVFWYGGSWAWGERRDYSFVGHALAARGMVAVIADYRPVPAVEYPVFLEDNAMAVRWTAERIAGFGGDRGAIFVAGHSAGAYNAAMLGLDPAYRHLSVRGVIGLSGPYDFLPLDTPTTRRVFGGAPDLAATQPVNLVTPAAPPMFLATGDGDRTVYPRNTVSLARRLRACGVPAIERHYPGIGHAGLLLALAKPFRRRAPVLDEIAAFVANTVRAGQSVALAKPCLNPILCIAT
jgi:acetyl esterase/lipase